MVLLFLQICFVFSIWENNFRPLSDYKQADVNVVEEYKSASRYQDVLPNIDTQYFQQMVN